MKQKYPIYRGSNLPALPKYPSETCAYKANGTTINCYQWLVVKLLYFAHWFRFWQLCAHLVGSEIYAILIQFYKSNKPAKRNAVRFIFLLLLRFDFKIIFVVVSDVDYKARSHCLYLVFEAF